MESTPTRPKSKEDFVGTAFIEELAKTQKEVYRVQPAEMVSHFYREQAVIDSYRGRQLLELLQNADDACSDYEGEKKIKLIFTDDYLIAANTGTPFTDQGIESLVISDKSPKRLQRNKYIGSKGLGFRSVLSWSTSPLVMSGKFLISFSPEYAKEAALNLSSEIPKLRQILNESEEANETLTVPILRFPSVPSIDDKLSRIAKEILDEGFDTVVLLPLPSGDQGVEIRQEISTQLDGITGETAIFCYHLESLEIEGEKKRSYQLIREINQDYQTILIQEEDVERIWSVYRKSTKLPESLVGKEFKRTPDFELAVAVPEAPIENSNHRLCVYFPTDDLLPMSMMAHATLDTDDSRKRIINHRANRFVLEQLAIYISEIAEIETSSTRTQRGIELLSGSEKCDNELIELGFKEALFKSCVQRKMYPKLSGNFGYASEVFRPPHQVWYDIASSDFLPDMLNVSSEFTINDWLDEHDIEWYDTKELSQIVSSWVQMLSPSLAGKLIGKLIDTEQLPRHPAPSVLLGSDGSILPLEHTLFLPSERDPISLPSWVHNFDFLDRDFTDSLRKEIGVPTNRELRQKLNQVGFKVEEFEVGNILRHVVKEAEAKEKEDPDKETVHSRSSG